MKKLIGPLLIGLATLMTGCLITSVYPFYDQKTLVWEPALLGGWNVIEESGESDERWEFVEKGTNSNALEVTYSSGGESSAMLGHVFKLRGELFLDLFGTGLKDDSQPPPIPSHFVLRVSQLTPTLKMATMDYEWLAELLEHNPKAVRHHAITDGENPDDKRIVLTADTAELQRFIIKHLKTDDAWEKPIEMQRGPAVNQPQSKPAQ
jgi:hypothetical protein